MRKVVRHISRTIYGALSSDWLFRATVAAFVIQAVWLVFTASYPLPFDEFAHVGAIQLYAKQWSWIVRLQPISTGIIGDVTREPSFLYHWLMSYPYRILDTFMNFNQVIIVLRLLNVAMVTGGIILFRKLLKEWNISKRIINIVLIAYVMTPIVPFLSAQVNYDNMMFLLTPIVLMYASRLIASNKKIVTNLAMFIFIGTATVLTKLTFLPIMAVTTAYVGIIVIARTRTNLVGVLRKSFTETPKNVSFYLVGLGTVCLLIIGGERYGGNLINYGTYQPDCKKVQPIELCTQFGPWYRNNITNVQNRPLEPPYGNPASFSQYWVCRILRGYFALFQHTPTKVISEREPYGPIVAKALLPLPIFFAATITIVGTVAVIWQRRSIWRNRYLKFSLVTVVSFVVIQWSYNYNSYLKAWKAEAIQARYTLPVMILAFTLVAWAINKSISSRHIKTVLVMSMFVCYVWGGGIAGWLIRADDTWRWQNSTVQTVNHKLQNVLMSTVIH